MSRKVRAKVIIFCFVCSVSVRKHKEHAVSQSVHSRSGRRDVEIQAGYRDGEQI